MSEAASLQSAGLEQSLRLRLFRELVRTRAFDETVLTLQRIGRVPAYYSCAGQEAHVGVALAISERDWIFTQYREQGVRLARGVSVQEELALWYGLPSASWDAVTRRITPMCPTIGSALPHATGFGYAARLLQKDEVAVALFGDGATSEGDFHAALNSAGVWKTPTVFFCQNNQYAQSTPLWEQTATRTLAEKAAAYGIPGVRIDGMDALAVYSTVQAALERARRGDGATLIESVCYRYGAHSTYDGTPVYRTRDEEAQWRAKDPIDRLRKQLASQGLLPADLEKQLRDETIAQVHAAIDALDAMARPSRAHATFATNRRISRRQLEQLHVAESSAGEPLTQPDPDRLWTLAEEPQPAGPTKALTLSEALNLALAEGMERDPKIIVLGEDVGREGGIFRVTAGLYERFGKARVLDTPLSEVCIAGSSVGMAIAGARCVPEIEFAGFSYSAFDQITFHIARYSWRTAGRISMPMVVRMPVGGGHGGLEGHSDSPEGLYAHAPGGLVIVYPSNPYDAKGLMASALESDEPIVFFEPVAQYFERQEGVPTERYLLPIGRARFVTRGRHVTCVTYGNCVAVAREASQRLQGEGVEVELIDLRTLKPWDEEAVLESVARTGRLLVMHESPMSGGIGAEIVATVSEKAGDLLEVPPVRIAHPDIMWAPGKLEFQSMMRAEAVVTAVREMLRG